MTAFLFGVMGAAAAFFAACAVDELRLGEYGRAAISLGLAIVETVAAGTIWGGA